jgi:hypothetical protein
MLCWWYSTSRCTFPCKSTSSFLPGWRGRGPDLGCNDRSNARLVSGFCGRLACDNIIAREGSAGFGMYMDN